MICYVPSASYGKTDGSSSSDFAALVGDFDGAPARILLEVPVATVLLEPSVILRFNERSMRSEKNAQFGFFNVLNETPFRKELTPNIFVPNKSPRFATRRCQWNDSGAMQT